MREYTISIKRAEAIERLPKEEDGWRWGSSKPRPSSPKATFLSPWPLPRSECTFWPEMQTKATVCDKKRFRNAIQNNRVSEGLHIDEYHWRTRGKMIRGKTKNNTLKCTVKHFPLTAKWSSIKFNIPVNPLYFHLITEHQRNTFMTVKVPLW